MTIIGLDSGVQYPEWMLRGLCAQTDPEAFFGDERANPARAKLVCRRCPVVTDCLEYALERDEEWGVWGGMTRHERAHLKQSRQLAEAA